MGWMGMWRRVAPKQALEKELVEEIRFHIEERTRELIDSGRTPEEARTEILSRFGDLEQVTAECQNADWERAERMRKKMAFETVGQDVVHVVRKLRRNPAFYGLIVFTLSVGLGASVGIFSIFEKVLLRPLPISEGDRVMVVWENDSATGTVREGASAADYFDFVERNRSFTALGMFATGSQVLLRDDGPARQVHILESSEGMRSALGISPAIGRWFSPLELAPGGPRVTLLSNAFWQDVYAGDPTVIGQQIVLDEEPAEVIGVLPEGATVLGRDVDAWMPLTRTPASSIRAQHDVQVIGRLLPGVTVSAAQTDMARIMAELEVEYPQDNTNRSAFVEPLGEVLRGPMRTTLWIMLASVLTVLAIAWVNVANLLLAKGASRVRETAIQSAIGAGRDRIRRRFLLEGAAVGALSGVLGLSLAGVGLSIVQAASLTWLADVGPIGLSTGGVVGVFTLSVVVGTLLGTIPAAQTFGLRLRSHLTSGGSTGPGPSRGLRVRRLLVAAQVSLALVLLLSASLLHGTVKNLSSVEPGFVAENVLRAEFTMPGSRILGFDTYPNWPEVFTTVETMVEGAESIPGVAIAAVALNHPLDRGFTNSFQIDGRPYDPNQGEMSNRIVSPSYFETAGLTLVEGRTLTNADRIGAQPVVVLNRTAAERYFPDEDAIGHRIGFWGQMRDVVGVVEDEKVHGLAADSPPAMYVSILQQPPIAGDLTLLARTNVPPLTLAGPMRTTLNRLDPEVPINSITTMEATVGEAMAREVTASRLLTAFTAVAVFLAVLGIHGVLSYLVSQRRKEVGVRMALGATQQDVVRLILGQGSGMIATGLVVGIGLSLASSRLLEGMLFGVGARAPWAYVLSGLGLGLVALLATALPARRAALVNPTESLRGDA